MLVRPARARISQVERFVVVANGESCRWEPVCALFLLPLSPPVLLSFSFYNELALVLIK